MVEFAHQLGEVLPQPAPKPLDPGAPVFEPSLGCVFKAQISRERSPHRVISLPPDSIAQENHIEASRCAIDDVVVITSLQSRPELASSRCRILGFDSDGGRYRVSVEDTGETIRLKPEKLHPCLFPQGLTAAKDTSMQTSLEYGITAFACTGLGGDLNWAPA